MSSLDICTIIEQCAAVGVAHITISKDVVEIHFGAPKALPKIEPIVPESTPQATPNPTIQADKLPDLVEERDSKELEDEDDLQELNISDPLEYENQLVRGELKNAETEES